MLRVLPALLCALVLLVMPGLGNEYAGAARKHQERPMLSRPVVIDDDRARLRGRVRTHRPKVVLQRHTGKRWVFERRVKVRKQRYRVTVPRGESAQRYRVKAGRQVSRARRVAAATSPTPTTKPVTPAPITEPPAPPAPTGPSDACGAQPSKADGRRWTCTFVDNFDGATLDPSKWVVQEHFATGDEHGVFACYRDDRDHVRVSDGALHLTVRSHEKPVACPALGGKSTRYTSGSINTYHLFSQAYGRFEARFKNTASAAPGLQEAFWLWPDDRNLLSLLWPAAGEIDIIETYSHQPELAIPFLHYNEDDNGGPIPGLNTAWHCKAARGTYNTYALEWTPGRMEIFVNGVSCLVNTSGNKAFHYPYILSLTQGLGVGANSLTSQTPIPATMSVDYVRVWK